MLFKYCEKCEFAFQSLKDALYDEPILQLPDPQWPFVSFTDTSKYAWTGVLTQPYQVKNGNNDNNGNNLPPSNIL